MKSQHRNFLNIWLLCLVPLAAVAEQADPLNSPQWDFMHESILDSEPYEFDNRVVVVGPASAEDAMNVPVSVRVTGLSDVQKIVVFADLNPIHKVLIFHPKKALPNLGFRIKIEQATPIRAAALTADGVWHVGGQWVDAAGGGCTAPSYGRESGTWADTLGQVRHRRWEREQNDIERLRLQIMHPMDTGLAPGIPAFYIDKLDLKRGEDDIIATLEIFEPVSENPYFTFDLADNSNQALYLSAHDINGNRINEDLE